MASLSDITIWHKTRLCMIDDKVGYFHCWEQYADVIAPGLTVGSHLGGQYSRVYGIVEFTDGVERVDPSKIKFIDEDHASLYSLVDHFNAVGYPNLVSPEDLKQAINKKGE